MATTWFELQTSWTGWVLKNWYSDPLAMLPPQFLHAFSFAAFQFRFKHFFICDKNTAMSQMYVTSFSSISYYSNVKLISNMQFRTNTSVLYLRYPCFNSWASPHTFSFQAIQTNNHATFFTNTLSLSDLVLTSQKK